jgi:hypothetical protein
LLEKQAAACLSCSTQEGQAEDVTPFSIARGTCESSQGPRIFRYDTFGSEDFWGGKIGLHRAIVGQKLGGVGPGVSPTLSLCPKVDAEALPSDLVASITGIGKRLDGWRNRDLNIGAIVATAPNLQPFSDLLGVDVATVKAVLSSWGPGRYDAELNMDGKAKRPDGKSAATMMPSAFGLAGVNQHTWTGGWGTVTYWNAYVANIQMYGKGTFIDSRLDNAKQYPVAANAGWGRKRDQPDLITAKLPALHFYQLAMPTPKAPAGSYDAEAAKRGQAVFNGTAVAQIGPVRDVQLTVRRRTKATSRRDKQRRAPASRIP